MNALVAKLITGTGQICESINGQLNNDVFAVTGISDHRLITGKFDSENGVGHVSCTELSFGLAKHVTKPRRQRPAAIGFVR